MNRSYMRRNPRFLGGVELTMGVDRYDIIDKAGMLIVYLVSGNNASKHIIEE